MDLTAAMHTIRPHQEPSTLFLSGREESFLDCDSFESFPKLKERFDWQITMKAIGQLNFII